jgi:predicted dehydrogenase
MDLFLWLLGDWRGIAIGTLDRNIEVEDVSIALCALSGLSTVANSALSPRQESYVRLDFQQATVEVSALYRYTNANWRFSLPDGVDNHEARASWQTLTEDVSSRHEIQLGEVLDSMERKERPPVSGAEARRILEFTASLYKSAFTAQPVRRGDIAPDDPFYYGMNGSSQTMGRT